MNAILRVSQLARDIFIKDIVELRLVIFYFSSNTKLILGLLHFAGRGGGLGFDNLHYLYELIFNT